MAPGRPPENPASARETPSGEAHAQRARSDSESHLEKILFEDDAKASEFLKGLISTNGIKGAWTTLSKRIQQVEEAHKELWSYSSRDVLEQGFVERDEYEAMVVVKHESALTQHLSRLEALEVTGELAMKADKKHEREVAELQDAAQSHKAVLERLGDRLEKAEALGSSRHAEVGLRHRQLEERMTVGEERLRSALLGLDARLKAQEEHRRLLDDSLQRQQEFLSSDQLQAHISSTCKEVLAHYVHKEEMKGELCSTVDFLLDPVRDRLRYLAQDIDEKAHALAEKDRMAKDALDQLDRRIVTSERAFSERIAEVVAQVDSCATMTEVRELEDQLNRMVQMSETAFHDLKTVTTKKVQEVVDRLSEFQVLLEDHEHALQHHAEELLNRSTKYDLVVCQQRVDKCAIKEKVDSDISDLRNTVSWQSMKLENLSYTKSFAGSILPQAAEATDAPPVPSPALSAPPPAAPPGSTPTTGTDEPRQKDRAHTAPADTTSVASTGLGTSQMDSVEHVSAAPAAVPEARPKTPAPVAHYVQHPAAMTEHCHLLNQQLESLAQAVLGLGHLAVKPNASGLSREARLEREVELLHHLSCVLHWIMHRRAPARWDPGKLTTFALRAMAFEADGAGAGAGEAQLMWPQLSSSPPRSARGKPRPGTVPQLGQQQGGLGQVKGPEGDGQERQFAQLSARAPTSTPTATTVPAPGFRRRRPARSTPRCTPIDAGLHAHAWPLHGGLPGSAPARHSSQEGPPTFGPTRLSP